MKQITKPTVRDVAKASGVSLGTVSRVLHGEQNVHPDIRNRVQTAITRLGYDPLRNMPLAQKARTRSLALVIPWSSPSISADAFYGTSMLSLKETATRHRCNMMLFSEAEMFERIRSGSTARMDGADAYVFFCPKDDMEPVLKVLRKQGRPCALIRRTTRVPGVITVGDNDADATRRIMEHLHGLGHRSVGMVLHRDHPVFAGRTGAYRAFTAEHGMPVLLSDLEGDTHDNLVRIVHGMLDGDSPPTAFFCTSDYTALDVIGILREQGLQVPDDISVAGYDNTEAGRMFHPALTTIRIPVSEMMAQAGRLLLEQLNGEAPLVTSIGLDAEIIVRGSTGPVPAR